MRRRFLTGVMITAGILLFSSAYASDYVGMVTGSKTGTYIQFGRDIARVCARYGLNIKVKESEGSLKNIQRMNSRENAAFGIVQSDVLGILEAKQPQVAKRLRMVYPLYNEEVHLLARKEIRRLEDLEGKVVATGTKGSGNWLTFANLLYKTKVKPRQKVTDMKPLDAVIAVLEGKVDAMIYVSGKPVALFEKLEQLKKKPRLGRLMEGVHFVPLNDPALLKEYYVSSSIGPSDYSWVESRTPTIAVKALLVSFDFSSQSTAYYKNRCQSLGVVAKAISDNLDELKRTGHKKWQMVHLDASVGRWKRDRCAHPSLDTPKSSDELYDALQDIFGE